MEREIRRLVATSLGREAEALAHVSRDASLFGREIALDSLAGANLMTAILEEFGVDIANDDLNLDSLESIATLSAFVADRWRAPVPTEP